MRLFLRVALLASIAITGTAHAVPVSGQGTWETTLLGRDINGNAVIQRDSNGLLDSSAVFLYDDVLNITWLRSASANGRMNWWTANTWATNLTVGNYTGWRLPTMIDTGAAV